MLILTDLMSRTHRIHVTNVIVLTLIGLVFVVSLTYLSQTLATYDIRPKYITMVFWVVCLSALTIAIIIRSTAISEVYTGIIHTLGRFKLFALCCITLVLLNLAHSVIPPFPALRDILYVAVPLFTCSMAFLLVFVPQVRTELRKYLYLAFTLYCLTVWIDVWWPGTFSFLETRAAGFAVNPNDGSFIVSILCIPLLNYRRITFTSLLLLFVCGLTMFMTLSRGGLLTYLALVGCYTWLVPAPSFKRRVRNHALVGAMGVVLLLAAFVSVQTLNYFDQPGTRARVEAIPRNALKLLGITYGNPEAYELLSESSRLLDARNALRLIRASPILGHGPRTDGRDMRGSHIMYLSVWVDFGVLGFMAYVGMLVSGVWSFWAMGYRSGTLLLAVVGSWSMFTHNMFDTRPLFILLGLYLALALYFEREMT